MISYNSVDVYAFMVNLTNSESTENVHNNREMYKISTVQWIFGMTFSRENKFLFRYF